jgi:hypothetical protein
MWSMFRYMLYRNIPPSYSLKTEAASNSQLLCLCIKPHGVTLQQNIILTDSVARTSKLTKPKLWDKFCNLHVTKYRVAGRALQTLEAAKYQVSNAFCGYCVLTFICLRATFLSYDVAHPAVRSWRQNSFRCFSRWPWNVLRNRMCGDACCRKEWGKFSAVFLQPIQDRGLYQTEEWFYEEPCFT